MPIASLVKQLNNVVARFINFTADYDLCFSPASEGLLNGYCWWNSVLEAVNWQGCQCRLRDCREDGLPFWSQVSSPGATTCNHYFFSVRVMRIPTTIFTQKIWMYHFGKFTNIWNCFCYQYCTVPPLLCCIILHCNITSLYCNLCCTAKILSLVFVSKALKQYWLNTPKMIQLKADCELKLASANLVSSSFSTKEHEGVILPKISGIEVLKMHYLYAVIEMCYQYTVIKFVDL